MNGRDIFKQLAFGTRTGRRKQTVGLSVLQSNAAAPSGFCGIDRQTHDGRGEDNNGLVATGDSKDESSDGDEETRDADDDVQLAPDEDTDADEPAEIMLYSGAKLPAEAPLERKRKKKNKEVDPAKADQIRKEELNHFRKLRNIYVSGSDVCAPIEHFSDLADRYELSATILSNIKEVGYDRPTPVQMQAVPVLFERRDLLASAPTGSGKTAAFLIPILHALENPKEVGYRAVIVAPTRELAKQIFFEAHRLARGTGLRPHFISDATKTTKLFRRKPAIMRKLDILVTTPNRLVHLLQAKPAVINLQNVEYLVIDESDKLFEADREGGFRDQLAVIYKACDGPRICRALFSATFAFEVEEWCKLNLNNVVMLSIGARNAATQTVDQRLVFVGAESGKLPALKQLIHQDFTPPVLIFVQTKQRAKELYRDISSEGIRVDAIHSDRDQQERDSVVSDFRAGKIWTLIATEVMGRGIDFKGVSLVVNYDFPLTSISYIHRIGRTGRAGHRGRAVTFFTEKDSANLRSIAHVMKRSGCEVPEYMLTLWKPTKNEKKEFRMRFRSKRKAPSSMKDAAAKVKPEKARKPTGIKKLKRLTSQSKNSTAAGRRRREKVSRK